MSTQPSQEPIDEAHATIIRLLARQGAEQWHRKQKERTRESRHLRTLQQR